ncbi:MAG: tetratricopeptide repeat protein [Planctomycetota bacterium]|jgi:hypothetical protein
MRLLLCLFPAVLLAACAAPPSRIPEPAAEEAPAPAPQRPAPDTGDIIEKGKTAYTVGEQQRIAESRNEYRLALVYRDKGDFQRAKQHCERAVYCWPSNYEARKLLAEINSILTR